MSNLNYPGFQKSSVSTAGAHTVIAGQSKDAVPAEQKAIPVHMKTQTADTYGIYVPYDDKQDRIDFLKKTLEALQNLTVTVEAQLQREIG